MFAAPSRARPKELVHDYLDSDAASPGALEESRAQPEKRGRFTGLKLGKVRRELRVEKSSPSRPPADSAPGWRAEPRQAFEAALDRYGKTRSDITRMQRESLPVLAH